MELYGAGEIVQGVRGEGKSLYAVGRIQEYMLRGCPVATNLDLYLEHLLPENNESIAYRLPDKPRLQDFELLPPAYDPAYKDADRNGVIVLDEIGLWLNCRNWNDKGRQEIINWLLLSRKRHWDLILLVQDHEMVDSQIKTTLCDYLVQASRTDRQKIPYLAPLMEFLGLRAFFPKFHIYEGYYGFAFMDKPQFVRRFRGTSLYDGYDTNQLFTDGMEVIEFKNESYTQAKVVDMRATYSFLPAAYLTKQIYVDRLQRQIDHIIAIDEDVDNMATKRKNFSSKAGDNMKIGFIVLAVGGYLAYRFLFSSAPVIPNAMATSAPSIVSTPSITLPTSTTPPVVAPPPVLPTPLPVDSKEPKQVAVPKEDFLSRLIDQYRPRLAIHATFNKGKALQVEHGIVEFYEQDQVVEKFTFKELRGLRVSVIPKTYGVDLITDVGTFPVTHWDLPKSKT